MMQVRENRRRMPKNHLFLALLLVVLAPLAAQAQIFKCVAENGEITFSQTPCPREDRKKNKEIEDGVNSTETGNKPVHGPDGEPAYGEEPVTLYARAAPQWSRVQDNPSKPEENVALSAQQRRAQEREEEQRLQCEDNIKAQINNINLQIRRGIASPLVESLRIKRRALENRLDAC